MTPRLKKEHGQATLEYVLVGVILMSMMGALAALWRFISSGGLSRLAEASASHAAFGFGGLFDALLF